MRSESGPMSYLFRLLLFLKISWNTDGGRNTVTIYNTQSLWGGFYIDVLVFKQSESKHRPIISKLPCPTYFWLGDSPKCTLCSSLFQKRLYLRLGKWEERKTSRMSSVPALSNLQGKQNVPKRKSTAHILVSPLMLLFFC